MEPLDIRIALMKAGVKQREIARKAVVTDQHVGKVIDGKSSSDRVQRLIAKAIGQPVALVFPDRYGKRAPTPGQERLAG